MLLQKEGPYQNLNPSLPPSRKKAELRPYSIQ